MTADEWVRHVTSAPLREIIGLVQAVSVGGVEPVSVRRSLSQAILSVRHDDEAQSVGFTPELVNLIRRALFSLADEISRRPGSRCDYSARADLPLLQQEHMHTDNAGELFFTDLSRLLTSAAGEPAQVAVVSIYALCLALGFRGVYAGYELEGLDDLRARVTECARPMLEAEPLSPDIVSLRWTRPKRPSRLWFPLLLLAVAVGVIAALATYRVEVRDASMDVADRLVRSSGGD